MNPKRADLVTGDLKMRVPNVQKSEREVGRILQTDGGYIESASSGDLAARYPTMTFTLKSRNQGCLRDGKLGESGKSD